VKPEAKRQLSFVFHQTMVIYVMETILFKITFSAEFHHKTLRGRTDGYFTIPKVKTRLADIKRS